MTPEQLEKYNRAAIDGSIPDDENPLFLFQSASTKVLVMGLNQEFSFTTLARLELEYRGLNLKGEWTGFNKSNSRKKSALKKGKKL